MTSQWSDALARRSRTQAGEILIETLITVLLLAIGVVALIGALLATIKNTAINEQFIRSGNEVTSMAEILDVVPYRNCATRTQYTNDLAAAYSEPNGYDGEILVTGVEYLDDAQASTPAWNSGPCTNDQGLQRLTLQVRRSGGLEIGSKLTVVKRDNVCDPALSPEPGEVC
ncbi:MAG: hypothetical protein M9922_13755 [Microthrixaceae bacterium]|nr:hypothetical protein [Microthrixaceae bacterium]